MNSPWPHFKTYSGPHLRRIAMPLGGIGTGTVALGGRGNLRDFEIVNRPAKGFTPPSTFLALRVADAADKVLFCKALEGPIPEEDYEGSSGCEVQNHGLPRFQEALFHASYPAATVELKDEQCPLQVQLEAFNPFEPGNVPDSSLPLLVLRARLHNPGPVKLRADIMASLANFLGTDGTDGHPEGASNTWVQGDNWQGILLESHSLAQDSPYFGTTLLAGVEGDETYTHRVGWSQRSWGDSLLEAWEDFLQDGALQAAPGDSVPTASLCGAVQVPPGETRCLTFLVTWNFPNRLTWNPEGERQSLPAGSPGGATASGPPVIGNHYSTLFKDAVAVARAVVPRLGELEALTVRFCEAFYHAHLPDCVKEAAAFNLSTLRTNTVFRTPDGRFFGWEGIHDRSGSCMGSCTHVWNYEQTTPFLFAEVARSMRETEFEQAVAANGLMAFRVGLPLETHRLSIMRAAADGQMGCLMKLYREWKLGGDVDWLKKLWPNARKTLEFCWLDGGWDADRDGFMEGCQHNTMDVEYYGPNPQMQTWYLGALSACAEMSNAVGEAGFAAQCSALAANGKNLMESRLWNGEYFEHEIRPTPPGEKILDGLRIGMGADDLKDPELQLGSGCLVDQLVGCYMAHVCGMEPLLASEKEVTTLKSILKYNRRAPSQFNHMRSYVLGEEPALLMASYPRGRRPERPFPYFNEVMTGFEHTVAAHLLYLGETAAGVKVLEDIRARYDGRKRNPFDEAECGRHYARAMASWAHLLALTGFDWDGREGQMRFALSDGTAKWFWSNGCAWGTFLQNHTEAGLELTLNVLGGELPLKTLVVGNTVVRAQNLTPGTGGWTGLIPLSQHL